MLTTDLCNNLGRIETLPLCCSQLVNQTVVSKLPWSYSIKYYFLFAILLTSKGQSRTPLHSLLWGEWKFMLQAHVYYTSPHISICFWSFHKTMPKSLLQIYKRVNGEFQWSFSQPHLPTASCLPPGTHLVNALYHAAPRELSIHVQKLLTLHFP